MKTVFQLADALAADETRLVPLGLVAASVSVIVDNSANVTTSVTNEPAPAVGSLWAALDMTNNGVCATGPITGIKLVANASGGSFQILATHEK
jgi:hypothetical protein